LSNKQGEVMTVLNEAKTLRGFLARAQE